VEPTLQFQMDRDRSVTAVFEEDPQATLTIAVTGSGTTSPAVGAYEEYIGQQVELTATPAAGWHFVRWEGGASGTSATTTITITEAETATAVFEADAAEYTLTVGVQGEGSVTPAVGDHSEPAGSEVTLTATADAGWEFSHWTGDIAATTASAKVTMSSSKRVQAVFTEIHEVTLTLTVGDNGATVPAAGAHTYAYGETVSVVVTPDSGYVYTGWVGDPTSADCVVNVLMDSDKEISIVFEQSPQVAIKTNKGTITVSLNAAKAPITVKNFLRYVNAGFYDGVDEKGATIFHRVIDGFMIQGGGFTEAMKQKTVYDAIKNESNNGLSNVKYTIAMARTQVADSATSQFFINTVNNTGLNYQSASNPGYCVFGSVVDGTSVVDAISKVATHTVGYYDDVPVDPVIIESVTVVEP
jgi:cyclophilin family peptidyl-prolyl cis-trans isomerase